MPGSFAIRLRCPLCEADSWVTLADRSETYEQIQQQTWEFKCREHGAQTGAPKEVISVAPLDDPPPSTQKSAFTFGNPISAEATKKIPRSSERTSLRIPVVVYGFTKERGAFHEETETQTVNASGALVMLRTKLAIGDSVFLMQRSNGLEQEVRVAYLDPYTDRETKVGLAFKHPIPDFWRRSRKQQRVPKMLRVTVKGTDARGNTFKQSSYTIDLSQDGARLDGIGFLTTPGQTIEVCRLWRKKKFRVVWIGHVGTTEANQVGVFGLQNEKDIWHVKFPESEPDENPDKSEKSKPPKK
ncbi:MAG TPA: PilZ domain-containing protein [Candidatus Acidoferrum sp.]|nr:PilZ domain-containing protein [Candidatus Acidoferrum sp.]